MRSVSASTAIPVIATPRTTSDAIITRRRSNRSLITPPINRNSTIGKLQATLTMENAVGTFDISKACHAIVTM